MKRSERETVAMNILAAGEWLDENMSFGYGYDGDTPSDELEKYAKLIVQGKVPIIGALKDPYEPRFGLPISEWYSWFAWKPVETVDRGRQWLRVVKKRRIQKYNYLDGGADTWFQYAVDIGG